MPTLNPEWLKRKIAEDGEEGEIGAGFEMFPLPPDTSTLGQAFNFKPCEKNPSVYCNCEGFYPGCREAPASVTGNPTGSS